jgi:hypothetical protein
MGSKIIFSIAFGPRQVRMTSATVLESSAGQNDVRERTDLCCNDIGSLGLPSGLTLGPYI